MTVAYVIDKTTWKRHSSGSVAKRGVSHSVHDSPDAARRFGPRDREIVPVWGNAEMKICRSQVENRVNEGDRKTPITGPWVFIHVAFCKFVNENHRGSAAFLFGHNLTGKNGSDIFLVRIRRFTSRSTTDGRPIIIVGHDDLFQSLFASSAAPARNGSDYGFSDQVAVCRRRTRLLSLWGRCRGGKEAGLGVAFFRSFFFFFGKLNPLGSVKYWRMKI